MYPITKAQIVAIWALVMGGVLGTIAMLCFIYFGRTPTQGENAPTLGFTPAEEAAISRLRCQPHFELIGRSTIETRSGWLRLYSIYVDPDCSNIDALLAEHATDFDNLPLLELSLVGCNVGDNGIDELRNVSSLVTLAVDLETLTDEQVERISKRLPDCEVVGGIHWPAVELPFVGDGTTTPAP